MIKKYLTTPEQLLTLRNTDTKIYTDDSDEESYYQFVNGVLCRIYKDCKEINVEIGLGTGFLGKYILEEEPFKEADEKDIGKLCCFWDFDEDDKQIGVLVELDTDSCPYNDGYTYYQHCRPLTPTEVAEITGYKVEG